jgi:hypothetical protein
MTYYQIKSSRINMSGWAGKRYRSAKLAAARQSIQYGRTNTQTEALITLGAKQPPLIDMTSQTSLSGIVACLIHPPLTLLKCI